MVCIYVLFNVYIFHSKPLDFTPSSEDMLGHVEDYVRRHSWTCCFHSKPLDFTPSNKKPIHNTVLLF
jgi:hypothetical protein